MIIHLIKWNYAISNLWAKSLYFKITLKQIATVFLVPFLRSPSLYSIRVNLWADSKPPLQVTSLCTRDYPLSRSNCFWANSIFLRKLRTGGHCRSLGTVQTVHLSLEEYSSVCLHWVLQMLECNLDMKIFSFKIHPQWWSCRISRTQAFLCHLRVVCPLRRYPPHLRE